MKTPEEMFYEWRQAFDESLDERMCKGEPIALQLLHRELGKETFLAGYKAAQEQLADVSKVMCNTTMEEIKAVDTGEITPIINLPTPAKWISVKDRLPEKAQVVLVAMPKGTVTLGGLHTKTQTWDVFLDMAIWTAEPNHWMPLPEPPKEEK